MSADRRALLSPPLQRALRPRLRALIRNAGFADFSANFDGRPADAGPIVGDEPFWALEANPLVIEPLEWAQIEAGLRQRARFVNAFLVDLYDRQQVLRDGLLPPEIILADPYYRRPCLRLDPDAVTPATLLRFDLVRGPTSWHVAQTRANTPIGLSFAVQNRRFMSQEASEVYRRLPEYHSIINFPLQLLDALRGLAPRAKGRKSSKAPSIVMLTAGPQDPFYTEHSFLARKMGLPLAKGDDLLVLDNHVYFKTIAGLERVDVIYRRLNDAHIDPVVFDTDRETAGIPGLLQCIRSGNVAVSNAIGAGVAESRALDAFLPRLMRFYLGEKPLLPPLPTHTCGDTDQLDYILENAGSLRIRPAHDPRLGDSRLYAPPLALNPGGPIPPEISQNPYGFVAQATLGSPLAPSPKRHAVQFSTYVLAHGRDLAVLPGGLVHIEGELPPPDRVGVTADVIVLRGDAAPTCEFPPESSAPDEPSPEALHHALGSRTAESLFWLGRYVERAETTARMLSIIEDVALEEIPARERRRWLPVWQGLLEATGHSSHRITARERPEAALSGDLSWRMTLDASHVSSIYSSVLSAVFNARKLRDFVSPEAWNVLRHLHGTLESLRRQGERVKFPRARAQTTAAINAVIVDINAFLSTAARTMLHDAGWQFFCMGMHLERSVMSCTALRHVLVSAIAAGPARTENPELSALLRMLGSQDAYRRLYQTRSQPRQAADFFLRQPDAPRSVLHNLLGFADAHGSLATPPDEAARVQAALARLIEKVKAVDTGTRFGGNAGDAANLGVFLAQLIDDIEGLHRLLSDHYFSHQARLSPDAGKL